MTYVKLETTSGITMINVNMVCGIVQYKETDTTQKIGMMTTWAYDIHMSSGTIFTTKETDKIQEIMEMI
jgi:hypothetical protein